MPKQHKPPLSLAVAIIARDAEKSLGRCLDSIRDYASQIVVCVDEDTKDRTAKVARAHGAKVLPIQVSDFHECPIHGRVRAQHFARARNESFSRLSKGADWWMWIDADDILTGGDKLGEMLAVVPPEVIGVWLPYEYAALQSGEIRRVNTVFHRERILRSSVGWEWRYRVHEVVTPLKDGPWLHSDLVRIAHQAGVHQQTSAERNARLLEIDLEENPEDHRAIFYMGNQYFALGMWEQAADWYERYTRLPETNPYELWQSYVYMSMAYQKLANPDAALQAAFGGIDCNPTHPEPYLQLAAVYLMSGEYDKSIYWSKQAEHKTEPPFFVFKNPMDYSFNRLVMQADALGQQGRITDAKQHLQAAQQVFPDERVEQAIARYESIERAEAQANAFVTLASSLDGRSGDLWDLDLPRDIRRFGRVRDVVMPTVLKSRVGDRPRVVFWCVVAPEEWAPPKVNETGVGGSETAAIEIAKRFAQAGWRADVYGDPGVYEGVYDDVGHFERKRLFKGEKADLMVSWRDPSAWRLPLETRARVLWMHDLNFGPQATQDIQHPSWDRVLGVSRWHADMLATYYGISNTDFVPNGINLERFDPTIRKVPWRCVYASAPDRGLLTLLEVWPRIVENEPGAELHIAYGWATFDVVARSYPAMQRYKERAMERMQQPGVIFRDRLPQDQLARLYSESYAWLYPCSFLEVSCISAMEAMAAGAVPVTSDAGALKETVGRYGFMVPGQPHSRAWQDFYVLTARAVMASPEVRLPMEKLIREHARELTWDRSFEKWLEIVEVLLRREVALAAYSV